MRLTKDEFLKGIENIKQMYEEEGIIIDVLGVDPEWVGGKWIWNYYMLFEEMCELPVNDIIGTDVDWFCWETEFGTRNNQITINSEDGEDFETYIIKSAEDLWDYWEKKTDYLRD